MKALFNKSQQSLDSRQLIKQLHKESFEIERYRVRKLMKKLGMVVKEDFMPQMTSAATLPSCTALWASMGWPTREVAVAGVSAYIAYYY